MLALASLSGAATTIDGDIMRFHVLGIPHTISTPAYSSCAFTQKVVKLCEMLMREGHEVIHYGHSASDLTCTDHVPVTDPLDMQQSYGKHDWRKSGFPDFKKTDQIYLAFYRRAINEIAARKKTGDFLLCSFGDFHKPVADAHPDLITVESGIGYPNGTFAKFKIYESYAIMHAYQGNKAAMAFDNEFWYDAVIPNAFDPADFEFARQKSDYLLFLGRLGSGKGLPIAIDIAETTKTHLIVAGQGARGPDSEYVTYIGVANPETRREILTHAKATICASTFLEPFCGVQIESMMSGTPVISSDRGAFAEYNKHGVTGFRCKTFEQFKWAAEHVGDINPHDCREWAEKFTLAKIAPHYTDYFKSVADVFGGGKGWYEPNPARIGLSTSSFF